MAAGAFSGIVTSALAGGEFSGGGTWLLTAGALASPEPSVSVFSVVTGNGNPLTEASTSISSPFLKVVISGVRLLVTLVLITTGFF